MFLLLPVRSYAQLSVVRVNRQHHFPKTVPAGNYSGIAWLGDNRYAVVNDKSEHEGYCLFSIDIDSVSGDILSVRMDSFHITGGNRTDLEGICYIPSSDSVVIQAENPVDDTVAIANYGWESLTYNPVTRLMWNCVENGDIRLCCRDSSGRLLASWPYKLDSPEAPHLPSSPYSQNVYGQPYAHGVSELCALDDGSLLVLEREVYVPRRKVGAWCKCKIYHLLFSDGQLDSADKILLTEWKTKMLPLSWQFANYEGMCLGPRLRDGSRVLLLCSDSQNQYKGLLRDWWRTIVIREQKSPPAESR